jgi:integrase
MSRRTKKNPAPGVYQRGDKFLATVRLKGFDAAMQMFPTAAAAIDWAARTRKELTTQRAQGVARRDVATLTVGALIREHLEDPEVKALRSYETVHDRLDWWVPNYGAVKVLDFGVLTIREARAKLMNRNHPCGRRKVSFATANRYLAVMRRAWTWGRNAGLIPSERSWPTDVMLTEPEGRTRFLSDVELKSLLDAARKRGATEYAMLIVSIATGVRRSELLNLTWGDVDLDRSTVRILKTKTGRARVAYLTPAAVAALRALRKADVVSPKHCFLDPHGAPYTENTLNWFRRVRAEAGLKDFRWHDLRHTCASYLAQNRATLMEIGSVLGHASPASTARYAHFVEGKAVTGHSALDEKLRGV